MKEILPLSHIRRCHLHTPALSWPRGVHGGGGRLVIVLAMNGLMSVGWCERCEGVRSQFYIEYLENRHERPIARYKHKSDLITMSSLKSATDIGQSQTRAL